MKVPLLPVGQLASQIRGVTYAKQDSSATPREGTIAVLRAGNIEDTGIVLRDLVYVPSSCVTADQFLCRHDVLVATSSGSLDVVGKAAQATRDLGVAFGAFCKVLRPNARVEPRYFGYYFQTPEYRRTVSRLAAGANINNLRNEHLDDLPVPVPSRDDQVRIADTLDKADAIRRRRTDAVRMTVDLLQATFVHMFGDPVTNPMAWPVGTLGDLVADFSYGTSEKCREDAQEGAVPVLRIPNIVGGEVNWDNLKHLPRIADPGLTLTHGDLLFVRTNGNPEHIGRCAVYDSERVALYASYLIRARLKAPRSAASYVQAALSMPSYRHVLTRAARTTAGNYNINVEGLRSLRLPVPPPDHMLRFKAISDQIKRIRSPLKDAAYAADQLFGSLVQRAFSCQLSSSEAVC